MLQKSGHESGLQERQTMLSKQAKPSQQMFENDGLFGQTAAFETGKDTTNGNIPVARIAKTSTWQEASTRPHEVSIGPTSATQNGSASHSMLVGSKVTSRLTGKKPPVGKIFSGDQASDNRINQQKKGSNHFIFMIGTLFYYFCLVMSQPLRSKMLW